MSRAGRIFMLSVLAAVFAGTAPTAVVDLGSGCREVGILTWGQFTGSTTSPQAFKTNCAGQITVPNISNAPTGSANTVIVYSTGRVPVIKDDVDWNKNVSLTLSSDPLVLNVKVWVLYLDPTCDLACVRAKMSNFIIWANGRLDAERTGIQLQGTGTWVSDQTGLAATNPVKKLVNFVDRSDCSSIPSAISAINDAKAMNLYIVKTVGGTRRGHTGEGSTCPGVVHPSPGEAAPLAASFVGWQVLSQTMLHEFGHNLGLAHPLDPNPTNMMESWSGDQRKFYTEGQTFRIFFSQDSAVNTVLSGQAGQRPCQPNIPTGGVPKPCPASVKTVWPEY